jgi:gliding motility-associated-like protein
VRKNLFILFLFQVGLLSGQAHFWPFGQGLGLDFNQNPPQLRSVPWQRTSTPQFQNDLNQCSVFEDDSGRVLVYFLNGQYVDANDNVIYSVPNYHRAYGNSVLSGNSEGSHQSNFFILNDTIYHTYTSGKKIVPFINSTYGGTVNLKVYLTQIIANASGNWLVHTIDSFPRVDYSVNYSNTFRLFDFHLDSAKFFVYSSVAASGANNPTIWNSAEKKLLMISPQGFIVSPLNLTSNEVAELYGSSVYSGLTKSIYYASHPNTSYIYRSIPAFLNSNFPATMQLQDSMAYYSPRDSLNLLNPRIRFFRVDPSQRYLFVSAEPYDVGFQRRYRITRFDLLATNQQEFQASAVDLKAPSKFVNDMQFGPDGNLYVLWGNGLWRDDPDQDNDRIGRIVNPTAVDTTQISCQVNFLTTQPWQAYAMFPDFTSRQKNFTYFEMLYACQDSVQFRLDFGRGVDSVRWNFGEPALGAANTSQDIDPVVAYPQAGTYFVRVELWWRGEVLHTLSDSVEVLPVIDFSLPEDTILCEGEELLLDVAQNFSVQYRWNTGDTTGEITVDSTGWYQVNLTNACGQMSDSIWVDYIPDPQASLRDTSLCEQDSNLLVSLPYNENYFYRWSTGADSSAIAINDSGTYFVSYGSYCDSISESFNIEKRPCSCELFIPNAFTPNGDGLNDEFIIVSPCEELEFELLIFNRWGTLVYEQSSGTPSWDGYYNGELTPGVYVYKINYRGRSMDGSVEGKESGSLTLLR